MDIFISYSRRDSAQALVLAERLRASGMEVWIDQHGIEAATTWSTEIVGAIEECKAFMLLLSESSVTSDNVLKELSLASESKRSIVPVEISATELPRSFKYQLAGIQRAQLSDFEGILRSLAKLGVARSGTSRQSGDVDEVPLRPTQLDMRKSLIILPFEDLSPAGEDNMWFADGLAGELIDALGHIKALRILDRKTSLGLRRTTVPTVEIGKLFNTRYFVEGSVRKFGDQIKISCSLLDIETGDRLWQESHKGKFEDIFEIQESVAQKVVDGLKLHLTKTEKSLLQERGTENAEAYELWVKAGEFFNRNTKEGLQLARQLSSEAIRLDPGFRGGYALKAEALASFCRSFGLDAVLLKEAEELANEALRIKPKVSGSYSVLSEIYFLQNRLPEAEAAAIEAVRIDPESFLTNFGLGGFYLNIHQHAKAIPVYEKAVRINPESFPTISNLVIACMGADEEAKAAHWASIAIPPYERHLRLHPEDESARVYYAFLLFYSGRIADAREAARNLDTIRDGLVLFNAACLHNVLQDYATGLRTFRKAIESGYRNIPAMREMLSEEKEGLLSLAGTPKYEEVRVLVEKLANEITA